MVLFTLGGVDYTDKINQHNYKMNAADVASTWTDANYRVHRDVYRTRVSGTFKMLFSKDEYEEFLSNYQSSINTDGSYTISVYVETAKETQEITATLTYKSVVRFRQDNGEEGAIEVDVTVTER